MRASSQTTSQGGNDDTFECKQGSMRVEVGVESCRAEK